MKKTISIDGMHCEHCANSIKSALLNISGVKSVKVNLSKHNAVAQLDGDIDDGIFKSAVESAGFEFKGTADKKGWF